MPQWFHARALLSPKPTSQVTFLSSLLPPVQVASLPLSWVQFKFFSVLWCYPGYNSCALQPGTPCSINPTCFLHFLWEQITAHTIPYITMHPPVPGLILEDGIDSLSWNVTNQTNQQTTNQGCVISQKSNDLKYVQERNHRNRLNSQKHQRSLSHQGTSSSGIPIQGASSNFTIPHQCWTTLNMNISDC